MDELMRTFAIIAVGALMVSVGWAAPETGKPWTAPAAGVEFVWVPSANLWASKFEITNREFRNFRPVHDSGAVREYALTGDRQPVVQVSCEDAVGFAEWLTESDRSQGHISEEQYYRLPSAEEWLAMAGCNDGRTYPWGEAWPPEGANCADASTPIAHPLNLVDYQDGHPVTSDVDESEGNANGVHGMGGNVAEWVSKWYTGKRRRRTVRGGSWRMNKPAYMDCAFRNGFKPDFRTDSIGIRLVLAGPPALDIDPRIVLGALGGIVFIISGFYGVRFLRKNMRRVKVAPDLPEPLPAAPTPSSLPQQDSGTSTTVLPPASRRDEQVAFADAPRHTPLGKNRTQAIDREQSDTQAPPEPLAPPEIGVAKSMDDTQERDKSIVASILEIRRQSQPREAEKGGLAPKLPKKRK
jgi:sulfatase modifying factor 1